ncbi:MULTISPECIES: hypothetical protein [Paenibacillus]|uniref:hypothetical protein n=1 Tax=Paenibacillus TaxID=44249 RepID=UPI00048F7D78|nr:MULTISPECIES: hypothetical protein [Paenibacillus]OMF67229.1 hypothetical protein BK143_25140 [Paenibacillus peoriae]OMF74465.1 hypothetical protein BK145_24080 [Paenibacillus peoriae]SFR10968.1 hypothetical protein SAMN04488603_10360 [Paenibacillus sp. cl130]
MQGMLERNRITAVTKPDVSNMSVCIENVKKAVLSNLQGPAAPTDYHQLMGRLHAAKAKLPKIYQETVAIPFIKELDKLGQQGFTEILIQDPSRTRAAGLMLDIAQSILQNGEGYNALATDAFQEIVSDLYDGFLSAEDREGIKEPDLSIIPALVKWGEPENGPYTWPADATAVFKVQAAIVSLPPAHATNGLLAWSSIPHEVCGHDILHADLGLIQELANVVRNRLNSENIGQGLPDYWASRIDETASDVLGVLNLGPAAAIGLIGYFRGMNAAFSGRAQLRNEGPTRDPHAADILRGYLGAYATALLEFDQAGAWAEVIESEVDKDLSNIKLNGRAIDANTAKRSARIVAEAIMKTKLASLENHSLDEIQNWRNEDESVAALLRTLLQTTGSLTDEHRSGFYAAHVVAAAITEGLSREADLQVIFNRMLSLLKLMHDTNPAWGPLFVQHPGDISRHLLYHPATPNLISL